MTLFVRFGRWFLQKIGGYTLLTLVLLIIIVSSIADGFSIFVRGTEFKPLLWLGFYGLVFAWWFARSKLPGWLVWILLVSLGFGFAFVVVGELSNPIFHLTRTAIRYAWDSLFALRREISIDSAPLQLAYAEVTIGIKSVWAFFESWVHGVFAREPLFNAVAASLVWGFILWLLSACMAWIQRRYALTMVAVLPAGLLLASGLSYTRSELVVLYPFGVAFLLLIALTSYRGRENHWLKNKMDYSEDSRLELSMIVVGLSILLTAFAIVVPRISFRSIVNFINQFTAPQIEKADDIFGSFGLVQKTGQQGTFQSALSVGMPRSHLLGSGPELSEQIVMSIRITGGMSAYVVQDLKLPLYWRSLTYDVYDGLGWQTSDVVFDYYQSGEIALDINLSYYQVLQQDVDLMRDSTNLVFSGGELVSVNKDYHLVHRVTPEGYIPGNLNIDVMGATTDAGDYRLQALIPVIGEEDLRNAPDNYPAWITDRYLVLPDGIPDRVYTLAKELTAGKTNPFDQAKAIEQYLRTYEYSLDVSPPPQQVDVVDYFLFDVPRGYCDYFASAMVVLARAVDIPARLAIGYFTGTYDEANQRYFVTEAEAHSWVEIYFPGVGWIPFEPTSGRPAIERSIQTLEAASRIDETGIDTIIPWWQRAIGSWSDALIRIPLAGLVLIVLWFSLDGWWLRQFPSDQTVDRLYRRLYRHGRRLRAPALKGGTPYEFAAKLETRLRSLVGRQESESVMARSIHEIHALTQIYAHRLYSGNPVPVSHQLQSVALWLSLRRKLLYARLLQFRSRFQSKESGNPGS